MSDKTSIPWRMNTDDEMVTSLEDFHKKAYGFIYAIEYTDNTYYIGKKDLRFSKKLPALKSGEQRPNSKRTRSIKDGKHVYFDVVQQESDWLTYEGSSERTDDLVVERRTILEVAYSKRQLTYLEVKWLFEENVLEQDNCHNQCILNMFFKGNLI